MNDEPSDQEPIGEDARIDVLGKRLDAVREREDQRIRPAKGAGADASYRMGSRVLAELVAGIGGGAFFGWVIDHFAGTSPWGLLVVMAFGIVAAFRNIIRIANQRSS